MTKKIGILTIHHTNNPGSILQAYSQASAFQNHFDDTGVEIIDYRARNKEMKEIKKIFINLIKLRFDPFNEYMTYKDSMDKYLPLGNKTITTDDYKKAIDFLKNEYDIIVVGSDELWKTISNKFQRPFPNIYWLAPEIKATKIAFAVSANRCEYKDISEKNRKIGKKLIENFDFLGVRDDHTSKLIKMLNVGNKIIHKVPDPTFANDLDMKSLEKVRNKIVKEGVNLQKPILGFYGSLPSHINNYNPNILLKYYKKQGYQIVSLKGKHSFSDIHLKGILDPFEWSIVFGLCDFCITTTYHGTIFSIKNKTPFLSIEHADYYKRIKGKIRDLLEEMSLTDNYCYLPDIKNKKELIHISNHSKDNFDKSMVEKKVYKMKNRYYKALKMVEILL